MCIELAVSIARRHVEDSDEMNGKRHLSCAGQNQGFGCGRHGGLFAELSSASVRHAPPPSHPRQPRAVPPQISPGWSVCPSAGPRLTVIVSVGFRSVHQVGCPRHLPLAPPRCDGLILTNEAYRRTAPIMQALSQQHRISCPMADGCPGYGVERQMHVPGPGRDLERNHRSFGLEVGALRRACTPRQRKNSIQMCPGHEAVLKMSRIRGLPAPEFHLSGGESHGYDHPV